MGKIPENLHPFWLLCLQALLGCSLGHELEDGAVLLNQFIVFHVFFSVLYIIDCVTTGAIEQLLHFLQLINIASILETPDAHGLGYGLEQGGFADATAALEHQGATVPAVLLHADLQTPGGQLVGLVVDEAELVVVALLAEVVEILDPLLNFLGELGLEQLVELFGGVLITPQRSSITMKILIEAAAYQILLDVGLAHQQLIQLLDPGALLHNLRDANRPEQLPDGVGVLDGFCLDFCLLLLESHGE